MQRICIRLGAGTRSFGRLLGDLSGNVLPMAAGGILVTAALVGGAVDMSRAYNVNNRLQAACDAGVLAGRRAVEDEGFTEEAEEQATTYFNANFNEDEQDASGTEFSATSDEEGNVVNATASTSVDTRIMRIFGFNDFDLSVSCSASMGVGNSDITFVLDSTGSMDSNKVDSGKKDGKGKAIMITRTEALQNAMKSFYDTVATSVSGSNARIRYSFVPYSTTVNVKYLLDNDQFDEDYLVDTMTVQSRYPVNWEATAANTGSDTLSPEAVRTVSDWTKVTTSPANWSKLDDCNAKRNADYKDTDWSAFGSPTSESETTSFDNATGKLKKGNTVKQDYQRTEYQCYRESSTTNSNCTSTNKCVIKKRVRGQVSRRYDYGLYDQIPVTEGNKTYQDLVYGPRSFDVSSYKQFSEITLPWWDSTTGSPKKTTSKKFSTWNGCIQERQTVPEESFTFTALENGTLIINPEEALDLDIDSEPTADDSTKWAPLWPEIAWYRTDSAGDRWAVNYTRYNSSSDRGGVTAGASCPHEMRLLEEMTEGEFDEYVDDLVAQGNTYHDIGLLWGARLSSPTGMFQDNVNEDPGNGGVISRHMVFMTDGALEPSITVNSAYGIEFHDRRITGSSGTGMQTARHRSRYLALCEAVKARGIRLWIIAFGTSLTNDLRTCGSDQSAFQANDAGQLNTHFQEIAKQVGELRVVQ